MRVLVVGNGKSGKSASKLLKKLGYFVSVIDDDRTLDQMQIDRLLDGLSFIVTSPGVLPESNLLQQAQRHNILVIDELELGFQHLQGKLVAITGTNGKTTTTSLVFKLLENDNTFVGGNIGVPVSSFALKTNACSTTVAEVSSFQLSRIKDFRPNVAVFLNFTQDHLNYHGTNQNYLNSKLNIFKNQQQTDFAVLNADDKVTSAIKLPASKIYYFSTKKRVNGCFIEKANIYFRDTTKVVPGCFRPVKIASTKDINLLGQHNLSNVLAAIVCAVILKVSKEQIKARLKEFMPIKHRLEFVAIVDGVTFINDSKATNVDSCVCAIKAMTEPTTLILGGSDKQCSFDEIFALENSCIKSYVAFRQTKNKIVECAKKFGKHVFEASTLSEATTLAYNLCTQNQTVLFSPACASFDMFSGYEERGKCFCGIVRSLKKSENNRLKINKKIQL